LSVYSYSLSFESWILFVDLLMTFVSWLLYLPLLNKLNGSFDCFQLTTIIFSPTDCFHICGSCLYGTRYLCHKITTLRVVIILDFMCQYQVLSYFSFLHFKWLVK
jgi:hypothetical protein